MKTKFTILIACLGFVCLANAAAPHSDVELALGEATAQKPLIRAPVVPNTVGVLTPATRDLVINLLSNDNEHIVADLIQTRWCFRKAANYTNVIGNIFLYFGSTASTVAAASTLIFPTAVPYILWSGATCFAVHLFGIGIAKCSATQEDIREQQLKNVTQALGLSIIPVEPVVIDAGATAPTAIATSAVPGTDVTHIQPPPAAVTLHSAAL